MSRVALPRVRKQRLRENLDAYVLIGPWLVGFLGLTVGPVIGSAVLAFAKWNLLTPPTLIGLANFQTMLADDLFWTSLYNTAYCTFFGEPIYLIVALIAAIAVNARLRLVNFYRTIDRARARDRRLPRGERHRRRGRRFCDPDDADRAAPGPADGPAAQAGRGLARRRRRDRPAAARRAPSGSSAPATSAARSPGCCARSARVLVYDPYLSLADAEALDVRSIPLDELFRASEVVSIHAPITPETHHLVGARELKLLRDGAIFVNCARSRVVDQDALLQTLQSSRIWAALDVFDQEPLPADSPFRRLDNVFLTPHQAGHTLDTHRRQGQEMVDEIGRFFTGEPLRYRIRPDVFALMA